LEGVPHDLTRWPDFEELFLGAGPATVVESQPFEEENLST
jgi:hypothetical protein